MPVPDFLIDGSDSYPMTVILAHGAGAAMDTPFMNAFAQGLAKSGLRVVRFEFPFMADRRDTGIRKPPNRMPILLETWGSVIEAFQDCPLIIGGKSMGGRVASMIAADIGNKSSPVMGLVCLGYPFHPAGKPEKLRLDHFETLQMPSLILQGTRDALGSRDDVAGYDLPDCARVHWLEDGDHSFKPRKKSGRTEQQNWDEAIQVLAKFAGEIS